MGTKRIEKIEKEENIMIEKVKKKTKKDEV